MNKKIIWLSALALSMSISQATLACGCGQAYVSGERYEKMTAKLDLTADQKEKIKMISAQAKDSLKPKIEEMRAVRMQLNEQADAATPDESKIDSLINQQKDIAGSIMKIRVMTRHQVAMILTDAQKVTLAKMVSDWKAKHMKKD